MQGKKIQYMGQKKTTDLQDIGCEMNTLEVRINIPSSKADTCQKAVEIETAGEMLRRSKVDLDQEGDTLLLKMQAEDLTALRASMNTYLRWVDMCLNLIDEEL